jgi:hypothetical protein
VPFRAPLLGSFLAGFLGRGEEVGLLGNDLSAVTNLACVAGPAGIVNAPSDYYHRALGDMLGDALADAIEAGDPVPFGLGLAVAFAVFEAEGSGEGEIGDRGPRVSGADFHMPSMIGVLKD